MKGNISKGLLRGEVAWTAQGFRLQGVAGDLLGSRGVASRARKHAPFRTAILHLLASMDHSGSGLKNSET